MIYAKLLFYEVAYAIQSYLNQEKINVFFSFFYRDVTLLCIHMYIHTYACMLNKLDYISKTEAFHNEENFSRSGREGEFICHTLGIECFHRV